MKFCRKEYWSGQLFPFPVDLPDPGIKPESPVLQTDSLPSEPLTEFQSNKVNCLKSKDSYKQKIRLVLLVPIKVVPFPRSGLWLVTWLWWWHIKATLTTFQQKLVCTHMSSSCQQKDKRISLGLHWKEISFTRPGALSTQCSFYNSIFVLLAMWFPSLWTRTWLTQLRRVEADPKLEPGCWLWSDLWFWGDCTSWSHWGLELSRLIWAAILSQDHRKQRP